MEARGEESDGMNGPEEIDRVREWAEVLLCERNEVRKGEVGGELRLTVGGRRAGIPAPSGGSPLGLVCA